MVPAYVKAGLVTDDTTRGIADCDPYGRARHRRDPRINGCAEVVGDDTGIDCARARAEQAYMAGYDRAILAAYPAARGENCVPTGSGRHR